MRKKIYLWLLVKRALKKYPSILAVTLITLVGIVLVAALILNQNPDNDKQKKVTVGIAGDTGDTFFGIGIDVIKEIDDSKYYIDIVSMSKDDAEKALMRDEIIGYIDIPENFIGSIAHMENIPATYYIPNKPQSLGIVLTKEVVDTVAIYITESQRAVIGLQGYISSNGLEKGKNLDELALRIITNAVFSRHSLYSREYTGGIYSISPTGYYISGLLLFFILLWGISCSGILMKKDYAIPKMLCSKGFGSIKQILCEYTVYTVITVITLLLLSVIFGIAFSHIPHTIPELSSVNISKCMMYTVKIIPVILAVCAMQFFMYELVRGTVASLLLQFLSAVILGYISGCFYPDYFFPKAFRAVSAMLPTGAGFTYMKQMLLSKSAVPQLAILLAYTAVFIAVSCCIRKKRLGGDGI